MLLREAACARQAATYAGFIRRQLSQQAVPQAETDAAATATQNQQIAARLAQLFRNEPDHAAKVVLGSLTAAQRAELLCILCQESNHLSTHTNKRLYPLRSSCAHVIAARLEGQQLASQAQQMGSSAADASTPPSMRALTLIALASGIPFVGFGFLDNLIMITAGEEIDATLGVKFGLSTLAAAGLGNLVADVAGIGFANSIEQAMRKSNWTQEPPLSPAQRLMKQTKLLRLVALGDDGPPHNFTACILETRQPSSVHFSLLFD